MQMFVFLIFALVWGVAASQVARRSGGNEVTGFVWGFLLGLIGLGVVFFQAHRRNRAALAAGV
jgi:uncharacterized membrane protein YeaQ/YmgE (transglycosylase-associated protein family)